MTGRLQGKAAFVTGGGAGIGRAISLAMANEGATVAVRRHRRAMPRRLLQRRPRSPRTAAQEFLSSATSPIGKRSRRRCRTSSTETGRLDVLVNNAVMFHYSPLTETPEDVVRRMLEVGDRRHAVVIAGRTPHLIASGGGAVINMSSVAVSFSIKNAAVYTSIKGAIDALTRQQAVELAGYGIRVQRSWRPDRCRHLARTV